MIDNFLSECFEHCVQINDIEGSYEAYKASHGFILLKDKGKPLGFFTVSLKPSMDAYSFNIFMHPKTPFSYFEKIVKHITIRSFKDTIDKEKEYATFFLDTWYPKFFNWIEDLGAPFQYYKIYNRYYIIYSKIPRDIVLNIYENNKEILNVLDEEIL